MLCHCCFDIMGIVVIPISSPWAWHLFVWWEGPSRSAAGRTSLFKNPTNVLKSDCLIGAQVKLQKRLRVLCMQPICKRGSEISLFRVSISRSFWNHLGEKKTHCSCNTLIELTIHFDCRKNTNTKYNNGDGPSDHHHHSFTAKSVTKSMPNKGSSKVTTPQLSQFTYNSQITTHDFHELWQQLTPETSYSSVQSSLSCTL